MTKIYRAICILDSTKEQNLSERDVSPEYLHIHIFEQSQVEPIESFLQRIPRSDEGGILYQWGKPIHLNTNKRRETASAQTIKEHGQIGIGSAWRGEEENGGIGGGEGFLFGSKNVRITRGNGVFDISEQEKYWIFQVANLEKGVQIFNDLQIKISDREDLKTKLLSKSLGKPFIATFDIEVEADTTFYSRSNGIFPEDAAKLKNPNQSLFKGENTTGGHVVGGKGQNAGDCKSLRDNTIAENTGLEFKIVSNVVLMPIKEVQIAKKDGRFRSPRTEIQLRSKEVQKKSLLNKQVAH